MKTSMLHFKAISMQFRFILAAIFLETLPVPVGSYDSNNFLFLCSVDKQSPYPTGTKPPIRCYLVTDNSHLNQIYKAWNFFSVYRPKLLPDQRIEFVGTPSPIKGLPDSLFLSVSYNPLDYPEFEEPEKGEVFKTSDDPDFEAMINYIKLSNLKVLWENFDQIQPGYQIYQTKLKALTNNFWQQHSTKTRWLRRKTLIAQKARKVSGEVDHKTLEPIGILLIKMIDPCFIKNLVNKHRKNKIPSTETNDSCKTYCQFLAVTPLVVRKEVAPQCQGLKMGKCKGSLCMCAKSRFGSKVTMAECHNRVVSVAGGTDAFSNRFPKEASGKKKGWFGWVPSLRRKKKS